MPTTILQGFQQLRSNLEITGLQTSTVSTRQANARDNVQSAMDVLDSFLTGSYKRSTMIAPLGDADVDVFIVLHSKHWSKDGQAALLDKVRRVLSDCYSEQTGVSRNGQAVTVRFSDFELDVVPGFNRKGGGYLIPDSISARWIPTDPKKHVSIWSQHNAAHGGDLIPLVKMIKCWNRCHSSLLRSFHLETLVLQVLQSVKISDFPSGARFVFDKARIAVESAVPDPAGYGNNIGGYLGREKRQAVKDRLERAYELARSAEVLASEGNLADAYKKWRIVFGDYFPAYG